jgi:hypothetical protein
MVVRESDQVNDNKKRKNPRRTWPDWYPVLATFRNCDRQKAVWQLVNTLVPLLCRCFPMDIHRP